MKWMKNLFVVLLVLAGCVSTPPKAPKEASFVLLHQSNRFGIVLPCGCHANPVGGLEREANYVAQVKKENKPTFFVDAGNAFMPKKATVKLSYYQDKSDAIIDMLNEAGLDVLAVGTNDLALGSQKLMALKKRARFPLIGTNIRDKDNNAPFSKYAIIEKGSLKIGFVSMMPNTPEMMAVAAKAGLILEDPVSSLEKVVNEIDPKVDLVVALSQFENSAAEKLAASLPVQIVVGSDPGIALGDFNFWSKESGTVVLETANEGQRVGRFDAHLRLPFRGFSSPSRMADHRAHVERVQKELKAKPSSERLASLERYMSMAQLENIEGGSEYTHSLVELGHIYEKKNRISKLIEKEVQRLKNKAYSE